MLLQQKSLVKDLLIKKTCCCANPTHTHFYTQHNTLVDQQMNNKTKQTKKPQEQLSSPLSQVLKTYDFGNFENCKLNNEVI